MHYHLTPQQQEDMSWTDWQWYRRVLEAQGIKMPPIQSGQSTKDSPTTDHSALDAMFGVVAGDQ